MVGAIPNVTGIGGAQGGPEALDLVPRHLMLA
jgi:hypothetical protein